jgi:hypothetical protein
MALALMNGPLALATGVGPYALYTSSTGQMLLQPHC